MATTIQTEDVMDADAASVVVIETVEWFTCVEREK
jgi:hypothetical protein